MPSVEDRLSRLEAAITSSSPNEATLPTYLTVNPATGAITATFSGIFSGSLILPEAAASGLTPTNSIQWQDNTATTREFIQGYTVHPGGYPAGHAIQAISESDSLDLASIVAFTAPSPSQSGGSFVEVSVGDAVNITTQTRNILSSDGSSGFLQNPEAGVSPGRTLGVAFTPNTIRSTFIIAVLGLSTLGGGTVDTIQVSINGVVYANVAYKAFGAIPGAAEIFVPISFIVPPNQTAEFAVATNAGNAGFPQIVSTAETPI